MSSPTRRSSPSPTVLKRPPHAADGGGSDAGATLLQFAAAAAALPALLFLLRLGYAVYAAAAAGGVAADLGVVVTEPWWWSPRPDLLRPAAAVDAWPIPRTLHVVPPLPPPGSGGGPAAAAPWDGTAPAASCRRLHPDWKFKVWDEAEALELVDELYPWAAAALDSYGDPEQRAAALRLLVLHAHGGVALSAGVGCRHRLDALRQFNAALVPLAPHPSSGDGSGGGGDGEATASTLLLAAPKGHPFLLAAARALPSYNHRYGGAALTALVSTGDLFLSRQLAAWSSGSSGGGGGGDSRAVLAMPASLLGAGPHPERAIFWVGGGPAAVAGSSAEGSLAAAAAAMPGAPVSSGGAPRRAGPERSPAAPPPGVAQPLAVAHEWRAWDASLALWVADHVGSVLLLLSCGFLAGYGWARHGPHLPLPRLRLPIARPLHDREE